MTETLIEGWSVSEQEIAREAFARAYARAIASLTEELRRRTAALSSADGIWALHDYLSI